jgi:DNA-binding transcriptional LysR family regulator
VRGLLRVTLSPALVTHLLMPDFADFARLYPEVEIAILSSDASANLTHRQADIAIRVVFNRGALPRNLHALKGPALSTAAYLSCDRLAAW